MPVHDNRLFQMGPVGAMFEHDELTTIAERMTRGGHLGDQRDIVSAPEDESGGSDAL